MTPITKQERERFAKYVATIRTNPRLVPSGAEMLEKAERFANALSSAEKRIEELEAENADLKISVLAFAGPAVVHYAELHGLPDGELYPQHYDLLEKCGGRMTDFRRAALQTEESGQ